MKKSFEYKLEEIKKIVPEILKNSDSKILLFDGPMGSGKTTLIKEMVRYLGSEDEASSPTFSIVNEYKTPQNKIFHFDLYRLEDEIEALDFGIEEYFSDENAWVFIEWPQLIENYIPENSQKIRIIVKNSNTRRIEID